MIGRVVLRVLAGLSLFAALLVGALAGFAVLPVTPMHVQRGPIPDGMALRVDLDPGVRLRVMSTATAGGEPRYEYRMASHAAPTSQPLLGRELTADCAETGWTAALGLRCHAELLVVVMPHRPVRLYYSAAGPKPSVDVDVFVEEQHVQ